MATNITSEAELNDVVCPLANGSISPSIDRRLAYLVSWFPKITETFIVREMHAVESLGVSIELFPIKRNWASIIQPEAQDYVERARFQPLFGLQVLKCNLRTILDRPWLYLSTLWILISANLGSLRFLTRALVFFPFAVATANRMQQLGIRHIHAHFASHPAAAAWIIWRFSGIGYSFVAHGSDLHRDQHMLLEKTRDAKFVVAISEYNRRMIIDKCGVEYAKKVHVVHCGVDPRQFSLRVNPTPFERGSGVFQIVCVGTLHEVKGQRFLIEACAQLKAAGVAFVCHLLGDGEDRTELERLVVKLGLENEVFFHGHVNSQKVAEQLRDADCLVTPSIFSRDGRREGIPVVLMEAMACGVAVVASKISGIPELVKDEFCGLLVEPGDVESIYGAIRRLQEDGELRKRLAMNADTHVRASFDSRTNARRLVELFEEHHL